MNRDFSDEIKEKTKICDDLPIHTINAIQPHGFLVVLAKTDWQILQASTNAPAFLLSGKNGGSTAYSFFDMLGEGCQEEFKRAVAAIEARPELEPCVAFSFKESKWEYWARLYSSGAGLVAECMPQSLKPEISTKTPNILEEAAWQSLRVNKPEEAADYIVKTLHEKVGFDRVMVCRFTPNWDSQVIAEARREGMASFFDLRFPHTDIPKRARELYVHNALRHIPDMDSEPVPIEPELNPATGETLDLSRSLLRAAPQIHREYVKNMAALSSTSLSIIVQGKLWGLILCHQKLPRVLSFDEYFLLTQIRTLACLMIDKSIEKEKLGQLEQKIEQFESIRVSLKHNADWTDALFLGADQKIAGLLRAEGLIFSVGKKVMTWGETPIRKEIDSLLGWLADRSNPDIYATDSLSSVYSKGAEIKKTACGLLVIPLSSHYPEYILAVRPEQIQTVKWGGNPADAIQWADGGRSYHPRSSFDLWKETVKDRSIEWREEEKKIAREIKHLFLEKMLGQRTQEGELLEKFLPMCAWCRKVKSSEDIWIPLENYMSSAYDENVTHAICEQCQRKQI